MAIFTVNNTNNSGTGSLRQAITNADASTGKNIINFSGLFDDGLAHTISLTGGGLSITDDITIQGRNPNLLTISDDSASRVFDITSGATATINGLTITNSYNASRSLSNLLTGGGGITNEGVLTLNNSIITGNTAYDNAKDSFGETIGSGGGIYNIGSLSVNNSTITNNTAIGFSYNANTVNGFVDFYTAEGNGIYNTGSLTVNHSTISSNSDTYVSSSATFVEGAGGGIYNTGSLTVNHSTISNNLVSNGSVKGGGIYNSGIAIVTYSSISGNTASNSDTNGAGGGIYGNNGTITVSNSTISGNTAGGGAGRGAGGGIYYSHGIITVNNSTISSNIASNYGGGIAVDNSSLSVSNSSISYNQGGGIGSEAYYYDDGFSTITVNDSTITGNSGSGIYITYNSLVDTNATLLSVSNSSISYNQGSGINVDCPSGTINVNNSLISGNKSGTDGGGIYNYFPTDGILSVDTINVNDSLISGNKSGANGGGIYINSGTITLNNSSISGNTALLGAGIFNYGIYFPGNSEGYGSVTVINSTISDNNATSGGGIYNAGNLSVSSSIIRDNYASNYGGGIYNISDFAPADYLGIVTVSYSTISDNTAGTAGGGIYNAPDPSFGDTLTTDHGNGGPHIYYTVNSLGIVTVSDSTISNNQAHFGAGIYNDAILTVDNSTLKHNKAFGIELTSGSYESGDGGGIYNNSNYGTTTLDYSTIACNFDTPLEDSTKVIKHDDVAGKFINKGHNWIGSTTATTAAAAAAADAV